jgi:hypothetical protein
MTEPESCDYCREAPVAHYGHVEGVLKGLVDSESPIRKGNGILYSYLVSGRYHKHHSTSDSWRRHDKSGVMCISEYQPRRMPDCGHAGWGIIGLHPHTMSSKLRTVSIHCGCKRWCYRRRTRSSTRQVTGRT